MCPTATRGGQALVLVESLPYGTSPDFTRWPGPCASSISSSRTAYILVVRRWGRANPTLGVPVQYCVALNAADSSKWDPHAG